jgi:hypothetical protein
LPEDQDLVNDDLQTFRPLSVPKADRGWFRLLERGVRRTQRMLRLPYANLFESRRFALAACQELAEADVLYERMSWMGWGGSWAAARLRRPLVVEYNGDPLLDLEAKGMAPGGLQRRLSLGLMRRSLGHAAHVVASGEGWRRHHRALASTHSASRPLRTAVRSSNGFSVEICAASTVRKSQSAPCGWSTWAGSSPGRACPS